MEVDAKALIIGFIVMMLLMFILILIVRSSTANSRLNEAHDTLKHVVNFVDKRNYYRFYPVCADISPKHYVALRQCLSAIASAATTSGSFEITEFEQPDPRDEEDGYLIIRNEHPDNTYDSRNFTMFRNSQVEKRGCDTPGLIAPGFTCRFVFEEKCLPGDNLQVRYEQLPVALKNC